MRVLLCVNTPMPAVCARLGRDLPSGGGWLPSLLDVLTSASDLELAVLSLDDRPLESGNGALSFKEDGVAYWHIPLAESRRQTLAHRWSGGPPDAAVVAACRHVIREFQPTLVHVNGTETAFGLVQHATRVPVLVSLQGILTGYLQFYFSGMSARPVISDTFSKRFVHGAGVIQGYRAMQRGAERERHILRLARFVSGRTDWDRQVAQLLAPRARYFHSDRVLRSPFYARQWQPSQAKEKVLVHVSGKGLECSVAALRLVLERGHDARLLVIGSARGSLMGSIALRRAREWGLESRIDFVGELGADEVAEVLSRCSVYVHSSHADNSPNALAEAQAVGVPVVATYVGGIPSMVQHDCTGLLVPRGDAVALAASVASLLDDPERARVLGQAARVVALERHRPSRVRDQTLAMYREIAQSGRP